MTSVPTSAGVALSSQALHRLLVITGLTSDILNSVDCWFFLAEVYRIRFQDSSPAGFSTLWTNRIGSGLRFYSSFWSGSGFSNFIFRIWRKHNHKKFWQRFKGSNVVYINCKCVKEALLHQTCRALQGYSSAPWHPISPQTTVIMLSSISSMETNICSLLVDRLKTVDKKSIQLKNKRMFFRAIAVFFR